MKRQVLLDTGPLVALVDRRDRHHAWANAIALPPPTHLTPHPPMADIRIKVAKDKAKLVKALRTGEGSTGLFQTYVDVMAFAE